MISSRTKERNNKYAKEWRSKNPGASNAASKRWREKNPTKNKEYRDNRRMAVLRYYSLGKMECDCCREKKIEFLSIDHIHGGGKKHLESIKYNLYGWLIKNGFPSGFRVLCHNCNFSHGRYGYCPHNKKI